MGWMQAGHGKRLLGSNTSDMVNELWPTSLAAASTTAVDDVLHREVRGGPLAAALNVGAVSQGRGGTHGPARATAQQRQ